MWNGHKGSKERRQSGEAIQRMEMVAFIHRMMEGRFTLRMTPKYGWRRWGVTPIDIWSKSYSGRANAKFSHGVSGIGASTGSTEHAKGTSCRKTMKRCSILWIGVGFQSGSPIGCMESQASNYCGLIFRNNWLNYSTF